MALTPKQESFAQNVASGKTQADAYRMAYDAGKMKDATIISKASILMADGNIRARVDELRKPIVEKLHITLESHLNDLKILRNAAAKNLQFSAAITAEGLRGKASGFYSEKAKDDDDVPMPTKVEIVVRDARK